MSFSEWKTYKVEELCRRIISGGTPSTTKKEYYGGDVPWLKTQEVNFNRIYDTDTKITKQGFENSSAKMIEPNSIIVAMYGATAAKLAINKIPLSTNQACCNLTVDEKKADYHFIYYYLRNEYSNLVNLTNGGAQQNLSSGVIKNFEIKAPDLKTQQRIASILASLDDAIELNQQINKTLEEIAKAIFKEWFVDFNFPNATEKFQETEIGKIPVGWKVYSFGDLVDTISETYRFGKKEKIIFLNTGDILQGEFLHHNYSEIATLPGQAKKSIKRNDILFSEIRPANKRFAFVNFDADEFVVSTKLMVLRSKGINPLLVYFLLTREEMLKQLQHLAESRSGTFPQITFSQLKDLKIALPNDETLDKFIKYLEAYYIQSKQIIEENQSLINLRNTLLPKLMKGEIEINLSLAKV